MYWRGVCMYDSITLSSILCSITWLRLDIRVYVRDLASVNNQSRKETLKRMTHYFSWTQNCISSNLYFRDPYQWVKLSYVQISAYFFTQYFLGLWPWTYIVHIHFDSIVEKIGILGGQTNKHVCQTWLLNIPLMPIYYV